MISIVIADDHPVVREGVRRVLSRKAGFELVGEAGTGMQAVGLAERLRPDVLVVDLDLPDMSGLDVVDRVRRAAPDTALVILSMCGGEAHAVEAIRRGALGFVSKTSDTSALVEAVRRAASGARWLDPALPARPRSSTSPDDPLRGITRREREILKLAAEGRTSAEIAALLGISPRTVETHRANFMAKLSLRNLTDLVRFALLNGILEPAPELTEQS